MYRARYKSSPVVASTMRPFSETGMAWYRVPKTGEDVRVSTGYVSPPLMQPKAALVAVLHTKSHAILVDGPIIREKTDRRTARGKFRMSVVTALNVDIS